MSEHENKTVRFQMLLSPSEAEAIDDWGFAHRVRTRAEAIRRLVDRGFRAEALYAAIAQAHDAGKVPDDLMDMADELFGSVRGKASSKNA